MVGNLDEILNILRKNGVESFKSKEFEVQFNVRAFLKDPLVDNNAPDTKFEKNQAANTDDDLFYSSEG